MGGAPGFWKHDISPLDRHSVSPKGKVILAERLNDSAEMRSRRVSVCLMWCDTSSQYPGLNPQEGTRIYV